MKAKLKQHIPHLMIALNLLVVITAIIDVTLRWMNHANAQVPQSAPPSIQLVALFFYLIPLVAVDLAVMLAMKCRVRSVLLFSACWMIAVLIPMLILELTGGFGGIEFFLLIFLILSALPILPILLLDAGMRVLMRYMKGKQG